MHLTPKSTDEKYLRTLWGTPAYLFHELHREFRFTVDGAARAENAKLSRWWGEEDNPLKRDWTGERVFINPPYDNPGAWLAKAWREVWFGNCELACLLVPASLDVAWFEIACLGEVQPFRGRVHFEEPPEIRAIRLAKGKKMSGPGGGAMLAIYRMPTVSDTIQQPVEMKFRSAKTGLILPERFAA